MTLPPTKESGIGLAVARLREGTEILRTGGGTTLTAEQCNLLLDERDALREALQAIQAVAVISQNHHSKDVRLENLREIENRARAVLERHP